MYIHGPLKYFYLLWKLLFFWKNPREQTDISYRDNKKITAICGYCNKSVSHNNFLKWLGSPTIEPNPIIFKESLVTDRLKKISADLSVERNFLVKRWATQYQSPYFCEHCYQMNQNSYALKIADVLIVVFY
jgi:hypothetical protein